MTLVEMPDAAHVVPAVNDHAACRPAGSRYAELFQILMRLKGFHEICVLYVRTHVAGQASTLKLVQQGGANWR